MVNRISFLRILRMSKIEMFKWFVNFRMIIAILFLIFMWSFAVEPLVEISNEMNSPLNFIEPFIAVFSSRVLCLMTPAVYVFLISDYPHMDSNSLFVFHCVNKREWIICQFVFFTISSLLFMLFMLLVTMLPNAYNSFVNNGWSLVVSRYGIYNPEKSASFAASLITKELYNQIAPYQAAVIFFIKLALFNSIRDNFITLPRY